MKYSKSDALKELERMADLEAMARYGIPENLLAKRKYDDRTANGLTKAIINYIRLMGGQAERIANMGRPIDQRRTVTDVIGRTREIGSIKWIRGSGNNGTADISIVVEGRAIKCEVKIGKDRMSAAQIKYKEDIERAGGLYVVATSFEQFRAWYKKEFNK